MTDDSLPEIPLGGGGEESEPPLTGEPESTASGESASTAGGESESTASGESGADAPTVPLDGDVTNPADDETEPVEVLVQLARDGEIDPWDIDIVAVTDAFLAELEARDLRTSGRALFYASVLLRMKSDALLAPDEPEQADEPEPWETAFDDREPVDPDEADPVDALEAEIDRRLERRSTRGSPETLDELVRELREAERDTWWKESREYDTSESPEPTGTQTLQYRGDADTRRDAEPDAGDVTENTHEEDIETVIETVRTALTRRYDQGRPEVLFREIRETGGEPVRTYLALLFLAHRGEVRLRQDDLFGDLWVQDPTAAAVGDEAVAD
jgi:segregation and condensation protein A